MARVLLADSLNDVDRAYLENLQHHEGYKVLVRLLNEKCSQANADVIRLDPDVPNYEKLLAEKQKKARFMSEFCSDVLGSMDAHINALVTQQTEEQEQQEKIRRLQEIARAVGAVAGPEIIPGR